MAAKKSAKKSAKRAKGVYLTTLDKKVPPGSFAFIVGDEVRVAKRNTSGRPVGAKNKRHGCKREPANKTGGRRAASKRRANRSGHGRPASPGDLAYQPWEPGWELEPGYAYKKVRGRWSEPVIVDEDHARRSSYTGDTIIDGTRMRVFKVGRSTYAQTYGRKRR